jgi:hypothetical protein
VTQTNIRVGSPPSFVVPYANISDRLRSPDRFTQAKSHLQHRDYKKANDLLNKIINDELSYNNEVAVFSSHINNNIRDTVNQKGAHNTDSSLQETDDPDEPPYYSINSIRLYLQAEHGRHSNLKIDKYDERFVKLHRQDNNTTTIAVGNIEIIQDLKNRIENDLRPEIIRKLSELVKELEQINNTYEEFRMETKVIKIDIEEHNFKGKCKNQYCNSWLK